MKRMLSLALTVACVTSIAACNKAEETTTPEPTASKAPTASTNPVSDKKIKASFLIQEHPSWPFKKDWTVWKNLQEATNIEFDFIPASGDAFSQKLKLMSATNDLPDLVGFNLATANELGVAGQLAKVNDYLHLMPNLKKILETEKDAKEVLTAGDGNIYFMPQIGLPKYTKVWLYRADIFAKHNLKPPTNTTELYDVLKKLKQLYPDSTPLVSRNTMSSPIGNWFLDLGPQWGTGDMVYFNRKTNKWQFGPMENNFKSMLQYLNKLYSEKLLDPEWATLATKQWEDKLYADDKAFITYDFIYRIETMLPLATQKNPNWKLLATEPLIQDGIGDKKYLVRSQIVQTDGYMISSKAKNKEELFKYADFLYGEEGARLSNFGKVGETAVKNADGTYNWTSDVKTPMNPNGKNEYTAYYGFLSLGSVLRNTPDSNQILYLSNKDVKSAFELFDKNNYGLPPAPVLKFTEAERKQVAELEAAIRDYTVPRMVAFVQNGDFDKWDDHVAKVKQLKIDQLLEIYNKMQERQK